MSINQHCSPNTFLPAVSFRDLTSTAGIHLPDGSASVPALNFSNDTNTGLYRSGADTLNVSCGGSNIFQLDATNKLNCLLPARFVDSFSAPTAEAFLYNDVDRARLLLRGSLGGVLSIGQPLADTNDLVIRTDNVTGNSIAIKSDLKFQDENFAENYFEIDKTGKGVKFPVNPNTPASYAPSVLNVYESASAIQPTWSNIGTFTSGTGKIQLSRVGNVVTAHFGDAVGTTAVGIVGAPAGSIPARFRPQADTWFVYRSLDNGTTDTGLLKIASDGSIDLSQSESGGNFAANPNSGWNAFAVSYSVASLA